MEFDMPGCGGCRTCEIACSFRHKGAFVPSVSSIKILDRQNEPGYFVVLVEKADETNIPCDGCKHLDTPLCVRYCKREEDLKAILGKFLGKRTRLVEEKNGGSSHGKE